MKPVTRYVLTLARAKKTRVAKNSAYQRIHLEGTPKELFFDFAKGKWLNLKKEGEFDYRGPVPFEIEGPNTYGVVPGVYHLQQPRTKANFPNEMREEARWFYGDMASVPSIIAQNLNLVLWEIVEKAYDRNINLMHPYSSLEVCNRILGVRNRG